LKITIIESEVYLAQSIANKLVEHHFETDIFRSVKEAMDSNGDVYLLSTGLQGQAIAPLIEKFRDKIIILMVNYINNDTVGEPIRLGANDYILKPFRIEELFRKIEHYKEYQELKLENKAYLRYISELHKEQSTQESVKLITPAILVSNSKTKAMKTIFEHAKENNIDITFVALNEPGWKEKLVPGKDRKLFCISNFKSLKKSEKEIFWNSLKELNFVLISDTELESSYNTITLSSSVSQLQNSSGIMTVDEYVKSTIELYQSQYPDTELSKKLGMSRKSLWEKRKKYDICKKK